jgi:hypothetical protein
MGCGNNDVFRDGLVSQPTEPSRAAARTPRSARAKAREQKDRERAKDDKLRQERERNERHLRELKEKIRENEKANKAHVRKVSIKPPGPRGRGQRGATDLFVAPAGSDFLQAPDEKRWTFVDPTGRAWTPDVVRSMARTHQQAKPYVHLKLHQGEQKGPSGRMEPMPDAPYIFGVVRKGMIDFSEGNDESDSASR